MPVRAKSQKKGQGSRNKRSGNKVSRKRKSLQRGGLSNQMNKRMKERNTIFTNQLINMHDILEGRSKAINFANLDSEGYGFLDEKGKFFPELCKMPEYQQSKEKCLAQPQCKYVYIQNNGTGVCEYSDCQDKKLDQCEIDSVEIENHKIPKCLKIKDRCFINPNLKISKANKDGKEEYKSTESFLNFESPEEAPFSQHMENKNLQTAFMYGGTKINLNNNHLNN